MASIEDPLLRAADLMTPMPFTIDPDETIESAVRIQQQHDIRHLPVCQEGKLVGMLSDRDLRSYLPHLRNLEAGDALSQLLGSAVSDAMRPSVICVDTETPLERVAELIVQFGVGALPVVEPNTLNLVGILSYIDLLKNSYPPAGLEPELASQPENDDGLNSLSETLGN